MHPWGGMIGMNFVMHEVLLKCIQNLVGKREATFARPWHRWGNKIGSDLRELEWEDLGWVPLAQDGDQ
jgi:hypothetical protein